MRYDGRDRSEARCGEGTGAALAGSKTSAGPCEPAADDLILLFNAQFAEAENTVLVRGTGEPLYQPSAAPGVPAQVVFAHGFFASALHEVAHWCIAGRQRRQLVDYGYWYKPDGRVAAEQRAFEQVEVKPQALEWMFAEAAGTMFHFSADNLGGQESDKAAWALFQQRVMAQIRRYLAGERLPRRAQLFLVAVSERYGTGKRWTDAARYRLDRPL